MNKIAQAEFDTRRDVVASLTFITPQVEKPVIHSQALTGGATKYLFEVEDHDIRVADLRPHADRFALDREGFALRAVPTTVADLYDDAVVESDYYDEIKDLLKAELGAAEVAIFDATRRSDGGTGAANKDGNRGPAGRIHVDYTAKSGPQRARDVFGAEEYDRLIAAGARIVQVNVWRPITGPVQRSPLALADASTVAEADLIATDQVFPDRVGEIYHLEQNPAQKWYYAPEMTRDEVLLIKGWDSYDSVAQFTPHTAFRLPDEDGKPARESIEVRTFAVIE
ncbi:MAG: CmcJ/NvfI family oxidoreductase [Pseudomonadota bacterium]